MPAPAESAGAVNDAGTRSWQTVRVSDGYGSFEMRLPVLRLTRAPGSPALVIDSVALQQLEKRVNSRIARVARAEAAALRADTVTNVVTHHNAPVIQPGLLGTLEFNDSAAPSQAAIERVAAMARIARALPGDLEVSASVGSSGPLMLDAALSRARQVYLGLVAAEPSLAQRGIRFTLQTTPGIPAPGYPDIRVSVFAVAER